MGRTVNRNPLSVDVKSLDEQYFNFAEFHGINSNKNYITIDQQSFEDSENVYVDQNGQLSTRPPVKQVTILPANESIVQMFKVNSIVIYHTKLLSGTYKVRFKYNDKWYDHEVSSQIKVMWFDDKYVIFMPDNIIAFQYDYEKGSIIWLNADDIIYIPITEIRKGSIVTENESKNIFTKAYMIRYLFEKGTITNDNELINQEVTVDIDGEKFTIVFKKDNSIVFSTQIGNIVDVDVIQSSIGIRTVFLAYNHYGKECYFSYDGDLYITLALPDLYAEDAGDTYKVVVLSDDGSIIYYHEGFSSAALENGETLKNHLFYINIPENASDLTSSLWSSIEYTNEPVKLNDWYGTEKYSVKYVVSAETYSKGDPHKLPTFNGVGHSPEAGKFVLILPGVFIGKVWQNSSSEYSETGTMTDLQDDRGIFILIFANNEVHTYYQILTDVSQAWPITSFDKNAFSAKIRMVPTNRTLNLVSFITKVEDDHGSELAFRYSMWLNSDFKPFYYIKNVSEGQTSMNVRFFCPTYLNKEDMYGFDGWINLGTDYYNNDLVVNLIGDNFTLLQAAKMHDKYETEEYDGLFTRVYDTVGYIDKYDPANYVLLGNSSSWLVTGRRTYPIKVTTTDKFQNITSELSTNFAVSLSGNVLTDKYYWYRGNIINLLSRDNESTIWPIKISESGTDFVYYAKDTGNIYTNTYTLATIDYIIHDENNEDHVYYLPDHTHNFITNVIAINNNIYQSTKQESKVYFPENSKVEFPDDITGFAIFSQTSLGVFTEDSVFEYQYDTSNDLFLLYPTKLTLGNKKGADIKTAYDGATIFITTLKGLVGMTYQDFVQSTEQIYNYLSENIMDLYDEFYTSPIKMYQFKNWLFMFKLDSPMVLIYDLRIKSWWKWTHTYNIQDILYNGENLLVQMNNTLYKYDSFAEDFCDFVDTKINWYIKSQKLHFNAPNNYKHIRSLSIITTQDTDSMRFKLEFTNYRNLNNLTDNYIVEYDIDEVSTVIKRVNFVKANAFQFTIMNDSTDRYPIKFVTPDIAIKYRITERVR